MDNLQRKRNSGKRPKKYKFKGNQHGKNKSEEKRSASGRKLNNTLPAFDDVDFYGYSFIDKSIVFKAIADCISCKICGGNVHIQCKRVAGLSEKINVVCKNCGEISSTRNSAVLGQRKNLPEINSRFVYALRILGQGLAGAKVFCGIMDLPQPVTVTAYNSLIRGIKDVSSKIAKNSMSLAVQEEIDANGGSTDLIAF